jgi:hypothetical protein
MTETSIEAAIFAVDPQSSGDYQSSCAEGDFVAAMNAGFEVPHPLGTLVFSTDSAVPRMPAALTELESRLVAIFPFPAFTSVTYFSLTGDLSAGATALRDERRDVVRVATTTADEVALGPSASSVTSRSVEVEEAVFEVARVNGVTQPAIMVVDLIFAPVIEAIEPDNGGPGGKFTIFGSNLVLQSGDPVSVLFAIPTEPDQPPDPGPFGIVGVPTPTAVVAVVPEMPQECEFPIVVSRSDGAEATSNEDFRVNLL